MLEIRTEQVLRLTRDVVLHTIPELDKHWAFNMETGEQYELNASAYYLLSQFTEPRMIEEALGAFSENFGLDKKTAEDDCLPLLEQYLGEGVLERS